MYPLFNRSPEANYFPTTWKFGNVSPIYRKDDRSLPSNYRPITLLNQVGNVMERCVHKRLYNYVTVDCGKEVKPSAGPGTGVCSTNNQG